MTNSTLMNIFDSRNELKVKLACLFFRESSVSYNIVEKFTVVSIFHYHVKFFFGFYYFIQLYNIRMPNLLQYFNFTCYSFNVFLIMYFIFFEDFYGHLYNKHIKLKIDIYLLFLLWEYVGLAWPIQMFLYQGICLYN